MFGQELQGFNKGEKGEYLKAFHGKFNFGKILEIKNKIIKMKEMGFNWK